MGLFEKIFLILKILYIPFLVFGAFFLIITVIAAIQSAVKKQSFNLDYVRKQFSSLPYGVIKLLLVIVVVLICFHVFQSKVSQQFLQINNINFKDTGTYCYYVKVDGENVPALIHIVERNGRRHYFLSEAQFDESMLPKGAYYEFSDSEEGRELYLSKESKINVQIIAEDGYYEFVTLKCELLNEHACSEKLIEPKASKWDYVLFVSKFIILLFELIIFLGYNEGRIDNLNSKNLIE